LPIPSTKKQWILGFEGVGDCQALHNIIITILYHEHFSHGMSIFNGNSVVDKTSPNHFKINLITFLDK
jgi:hypothetical protein